MYIMRNTLNPPFIYIKSAFIAKVIDVYMARSTSG